MPKTKELLLILLIIIPAACSDENPINPGEVIPGLELNYGIDGSLRISYTLTNKSPDTLYLPYKHWPFCTFLIHRIYYPKDTAWVEALYDEKTNSFRHPDNFRFSGIIILCQMDMPPRELLPGAKYEEKIEAEFEETGKMKIVIYYSNKLPYLYEDIKSVEAELNYPN